MKIIPVLDLKGGHIVQGIAGQRELYKPIHTVYSDSTDPLTLATALREQFGTRHFYLADLDALAGEPPALLTLQALRAAGLQVDVDAGISHSHGLAPLFAAGAHRAIIALETLTSPQLIREAVREHGPEKVVFSLDLRNGKPVCPYGSWSNADPLEIAVAAWEAGIRQMIVLDIAAVGTGSGLTTSQLCRKIAGRLPDLELISGGGIRTEQEVEALAEARFLSGLLVASLLHQGKLSPTLVRKLNAQDEAAE